MSTSESMGTTTKPGIQNKQQLDIRKINQELKFLYCKKQQPNGKLYRTHLECTKYWNVTWQYMHSIINAQLDKLMDPIYHRLNKKLDNLQQNANHKRNTTTTTHTFYTRIVNLTQTKFNKDQTNALQLGLDYAIERNPKQYLNTLTVETENAIRHLDTHLRGTFRHLAYRKIKQIAETNTYNALHKRYQYNLKQIKKRSVPYNTRTL